MTTSRSRGADRSPRERRQVWEQRWQEKEGQDFIWHLDDAPHELVRLLDEVRPPPGAALDLGCGAGVTTAYLARCFPLVVGLDVALGAVTEARRLVGERGHHAAFVVADASVLPFRPAAFSFVFDRGCLQNLPRASWPSYFTENERVLLAGGLLQLLCSKGDRQGLPPLLSLGGLRVRLRRLLGRGGKGGGPQFLSHALLTRLAPASLEVRTMEDFPFTTANGRRRTFTHGVFRRR